MKKFRNLKTGELICSMENLTEDMVEDLLKNSKEFEQVENSEKVSDIIDKIIENRMVRGQRFTKNIESFVKGCMRDYEKIRNDCNFCKNNITRNNFLCSSCMGYSNFEMKVKKFKVKGYLGGIVRGIRNVNSFGALYAMFRGYKLNELHLNVKIESREEIEEFILFLNEVSESFMRKEK